MEAETLIITFVLFLTVAVLVVTLFKDLGVDKRLSIIVEGESLFNDGGANGGLHHPGGIAAGMSRFNATDWILAAELREGLER